jgi:uncharacterized protein YjbJ (UPF0337 family)
MYKTPRWARVDEPRRGTQETLRSDVARERHGRTGTPLAVVKGDQGEIDMAGKADELKGRVKEAVGALTGNEKLKEEGRVDQAAGKVKDTAAKVIDTAKDVLKAKKR